jgi:glycosyltransferase involved in cell wall biosynthesis
MAKPIIVIITDAWEPQVNGVVTTYKNIIKNLILDDNRHVVVIDPSRFITLPNPFYKDVPISLCSYTEMHRLITLYHNHSMGASFHVATEGVLGFQAKRVLRKLDIKHTSAYHTKFPEFFKEMYHIPVSWTRWYFDWFHKDSETVMMSSQSVADRFPHWNCKVLGKGYDECFTFKFKSHNPNKIPILFYVGRVSEEKNIEAFCSLNIHATKIVVGDGPAKRKLVKKYPDVWFSGYKFGEELAECYQLADCLVFPSKTDTYGIVVLESMACGTPVAAYPVDGAIDQIKNGVNGYTDENLDIAVMRALTVSRQTTYESVKDISWKNSAKQFIEYLK